MENEKNIYQMDVFGTKFKVFLYLLLFQTFQYGGKVQRYPPTS